VSEAFDLRVAVFGDVVAEVADWSAPAPVADWTAREVVRHLIDWPTAFLGHVGVEVPAEPRGASVDVDPVEAWAAHVARLNQVLAVSGDQIVGGTPMGEQRLADLLDQIYVGDVFLHTWDLARAANVVAPLDEETCRAMLAGMEPLEEMLRGSGQYGPRVEVAGERSAMDRLMGFIGRDPDWHP
jgi:uncharacterized protein (TIGR03086 family)